MAKDGRDGERMMMKQVQKGAKDTDPIELLADREAEISSFTLRLYRVRT